MKSALPISSLPRPLASRRRISHSRSVSRALALARRPGELARDHRVDVGAAAGRDRHGADELVERRLLEHEALDAEIHRPQQRRAVAEPGEDDGARARRDGAQLLDHLEPVAVAEPEVDERHVRLEARRACARPPGRRARDRHARSASSRTPISTAWAMAGWSSTITHVVELIVRSTAQLVRPLRRRPVRVIQPSLLSAAAAAACRYAETGTNGSHHRTQAARAGRATPLFGGSGLSPDMADRGNVRVRRRGEARARAARRRSTRRSAAGRRTRGASRRPAPAAGRCRPRAGRRSSPTSRPARSTALWRPGDVVADDRERERVGARDGAAVGVEELGVLDQLVDERDGGQPCGREPRAGLVELASPTNGRPFRRASPASSRVAARMYGTAPGSTSRGSELGDPQRGLGLVGGRRPRGRACARARRRARRRRAPCAPPRSRARPGRAAPRASRARAASARTAPPSHSRERGRIPEERRLAVGEARCTARASRRRARPRRSAAAARRAPSCGRASRRGSGSAAG